MVFKIMKLTENQKINEIIVSILCDLNTISTSITHKLQLVNELKQIYAVALKNNEILRPDYNINVKRLNEIELNLNKKVTNKSSRKDSNNICKILSIFLCIVIGLMLLAIILV